MTKQEKQQNTSVMRPPVVVVMGHIDHGKSTLLDYIRKSNTVAKEAGGITQHVAAYEIQHGDKKMTFLDTPGHEAFCSVRKTSSSIADIAILVVSAEDGVMPQTKEALECIKNDKIPFIVAINKIDSPRADLEKTKYNLIENEIYLEGMGGDISYIPISAKDGTGINDLLDLIILNSEIDIKEYDPSKNATGIIVEAHKDTKSGITATLIIKDGELKTGNFLAAAGAFSPVRSIIDTSKNKHTNAFPSTPVIISGWNTLPPVGSEFYSFDTKKEAESESNSLQEIFEQKESFKTNTESEFILPLIIKGDVGGSIDALKFELTKVQSDEISFVIIEEGVGPINESDIKRALTQENTIVLGFNVSIDKEAKALIERENIIVHTSSIIYELTEKVLETAKKLKPKKEIIKVIGKAKVLKIFGKDKNLQVIGAKVKEGEIILNKTVSIIRNQQEIGTGKIKELQQQKASAEKVLEGNECGVAIDSKVILAENDILECIEKEIK